MSFSRFFWLPSASSSLSSTFRTVASFFETAPSTCFSFLLPRVGFECSATKWNLTGDMFSSLRVLFKDFLGRLRSCSYWKQKLSSLSSSCLYSYSSSFSGSDTFNLHFRHSFWPGNAIYPLIRISFAKDRLISLRLPERKYESYKY